MHRFGDHSNKINQRLKTILNCGVASGAIVASVLVFFAFSEDSIGYSSNLANYCEENGWLYILFFLTTLVAASVAGFVTFFRKRYLAFGMLLVAVLCSSFALFAPEKSAWVANYFTQDRIRERYATGLQIQLNKQVEYQDIKLHYSYWPHSKSNHLHASGNVKNQDEYDQIVKRLQEAENWSIHWSVTIDGRMPKSPDRFLRSADLP